MRDTSSRKNKHPKLTAIRFRDLIIAELVGALISGLIGGLVHLAFCDWHIESKVESICDLLKQKDQESCKKAIDSIMDSAEKNIDNYTVSV